MTYFYNGGNFHIDGWNVASSTNTVMFNLVTPIPAPAAKDAPPESLLAWLDRRVDETCAWSGLRAA